MKYLSLLFFICLFCCNAAAKSFDRVIFFGDSLSDNGNLYKKSFHIIPKSPPYFQGRFSNGPTWAENVGKVLGSYKIYAVGGATVVLHKPSTRFLAPTTLRKQIYEYLTDTLFEDKSQILFSFWMGNNDYLFDQESNPQKIVNRISWAIDKLIKHGAKYFLVLNLPDLSRIPSVQKGNAIERIHQLSVANNELLAKMVMDIKHQYPEVTITFVDIFSLFNDVMDNPEKYNKKYNIHITNTTEGCWQGNYYLRHINDEIDRELAGMNSKRVNFNTKALSKTIVNSPSLREAYIVGRLYDEGIKPCANPQEYLFWDQTHPTAIAHTILSGIVMEKLAELH